MQYRLFSKIPGLPISTLGLGCTRLPTVGTASMFENQASPRFAYDAFIVKAGSGADQCTECAECEPKCPQNIPIIAMLARAHAHLTT